jgi:cobaltochelatase CobN
MTEPKRAAGGRNATGGLPQPDDPDIPPPHHWLATYWYLQKSVDALVVMGADGPLEYLPGKRVGLSETCFPNISLGDLPVIYPYVMNNTGEGMIAKRRGRAVLVDHLSGPVARADSLSSRMDDLEELHRQYLHVAKLGEARQREIAAALRAGLAEIGLLAEGADDAVFARAVEELPRRLTAMRRRVLSVGRHTLGRAPDAETAALYLAEAKGPEGRHIDEPALSAGLAACAEETEAVARALSGGFVPPGPSAHLSRGRLDVLPTGRNFYGIDLSLLPTRAACAVGARMGEKLLRAYLADEGDYPKTIGITLWSSDAFQADGELAAQILWLMGFAPKYDDGGKVKGVEALPLDALTLALDDGSLRRVRASKWWCSMCSIVLDPCPASMPCRQGVSEEIVLDEPEIRTHPRHGGADGGTEGVADRRDRRRTETHGQLSLFLVARRVLWRGGGPGARRLGLAGRRRSGGNSGQLDRPCLWRRRQGSRPAAPGDAGRIRRAGEADGRVLSARRLGGGRSFAYGCYVGTQGGAAAAKRGLGGGGMRLYWGDTQTTAEGEVRSVKEEISLSLATSLLNADWFAEMKKQGFAGANAVSNRANHLFAWSATSRDVEAAQFDAVHDMYVRNAANRDWLRENNVYALEELTRRLLEANARDLWAADETRLDELKAAVLDLEGDIEDRMGGAGGEFQGSSVDIKTRAEVKEWGYDFRLK